MNASAFYYRERQFLKKKGLAWLGVCVEAAKIDKTICKIKDELWVYIFTVVFFLNQSLALLS